MPVIFSCSRVGAPGKKEGKERGERGERREREEEEATTTIELTLTNHVA